MCWLDRFRRDEQGSATIEFVLWLPIIAALLVVMIDATTLYITHTEMWNVARDTARRMVTGAVLTEAEAEAHAANAMKLRDYPYYIEANYDLSSGAEVIIGLRVNDMSIVGYSLLTIFGADIMARVVMRPDPLVPFDSSGSSPGPGPNDDCPGQSQNC